LAFYIDTNWIPAPAKSSEIDVICIGDRPHPGCCLTVLQVSGKKLEEREYSVGVIPDKTLIKGDEPVWVEYLAAMDLPVRSGM